jgi:hypothetical protein
MAKSVSARGARLSRLIRAGFESLKLQGIPYHRKDREPGQEGALVDGTPTRYERLRAAYFARLRQRDPREPHHSIRLADDD